LTFKRVFGVKLAQIHSAFPEVFYIQIKKPQTDGAKNRTFRCSLQFTACGKTIELFRPRRRAKSTITIIGMAIEDVRYTLAIGALKLGDNPRPDGKTRNSETLGRIFPNLND